MTSQELLRESARLRLKLQMNNRLRLECMAAISKLFREFQEPIDDQLLASLLLALPTELVGQAAVYVAAENSTDGTRADNRPTQPPIDRPTQPGAVHRPTQPPPPIERPTDPDTDFAR